MSLHPLRCLPLSLSPPGLSSSPPRRFSPHLFSFLKLVQGHTFAENEGKEGRDEFRGSGLPRGQRPEHLQELRANRSCESKAARTCLTLTQIGECQVAPPPPAHPHPTPTYPLAFSRRLTKQIRTANSVLLSIYRVTTRLSHRFWVGWGPSTRCGSCWSKQQWILFGMAMNESVVGLIPLWRAGEIYI